MLLTEYHPGGDPKNPPKDAPSALHSVIVPNVNLPKVRNSLPRSITTQWAQEFDSGCGGLEDLLHRRLEDLDKDADFISKIGTAREVQQVGQGRVLGDGRRLWFEQRRKAARRAVL